MNLLQYKSNEMFSSTELIRKSKMVFDKVSKKEIEKAVILRDGKPSFMLLDFFKYEELITEYLDLKEKVKQKNTSQKEEIKNFKEINDDDLKDALAQIEELDLDLKKEPRIKKKEESIKDFWE